MEDIYKTFLVKAVKIQVLMLLIFFLGLNYITTSYEIELERIVSARYSQDRQKPAQEAHTVAWVHYRHDDSDAWLKSVK